jgi:hypothetical protein
VSYDVLNKNKSVHCNNKLYVIAARDFMYPGISPPYIKSRGMKLGDRCGQMRGKLPPSSLAEATATRNYMYRSKGEEV